MIDWTRSLPAPASLAVQAEKGARPRTDEIARRLHIDSFQKCYLCERPIPFASDVDVDHRHPLAAGGAEYDWSNLFATNPRCNQRRGKGWPEGGLLDPAGPEGVERHLVQTHRYNQHEKLFAVFAAVDPRNRAAVNTARELDHLHNEEGQDAAGELRDAIASRLEEVSRAVLQREKTAKKRPDGTGPVALARWQASMRRHDRKLRRMAAREAPFTALVRDHLARILPGFDPDAPGDGP